MTEIIPKHRESPAHCVRSNPGYRTPMKLPALLALLLAAGLATTAFSADTVHSGHHPGSGGGPAMGPAMGASGAADARMQVVFPEHLRIHTLANMRDHLATLAAIQQALASGAFDEASRLAEHRLGMSSLELHGAHDVAPYMPEGMQRAGTAMHRAASRFAVAAQDASVSADPKPALAALADLTRTCVACHDAYRLQ